MGVCICRGGGVGRLMLGGCCVAWLDWSVGAFKLGRPPHTTRTTAPSTHPPISSQPTPKNRQRELLEEFQQEEQSKKNASNSPFAMFQTRVKSAYERIKRFMGTGEKKEGEEGKKEEKEKEKDGGAKEASG